MDISNQNKIKTYLQFCYKSGKMCFGETSIIKMMMGKVNLLILANDIADNQKKKYLEKANFYNVKALFLFDKVTLGSLFSKNDVACVGIMDNSLGKQILKILDLENN